MRVEFLNDTIRDYSDSYEDIEVDSGRIVVGLMIAAFAAGMVLGFIIGDLVVI